MQCSFIPSCSRSVLFAETLWWVIWNDISLFTRRTQRSTYINSFTNRQEYSGSRLQRWEYTWAVVNTLDCRFQPFIGSTSPFFHSIFPCHRVGRRGWKVEDCCIFGVLGVDLGYWLSPLMRGRGRATVKSRDQAFDWSQKTRFPRLLFWW